METLITVLILLFAVVVSGGVARFLPQAIPLPLIQIGTGILIAAVADLGIVLDPELFFVLFLPPLLFLDGWRIPKQGLFADIGAILDLALGLVVFTVLGIGFFVHWMIPGIPLPVAFALAAILSPTDPVAVSAIAGRVKVPKRLMHILEGESLLNDASGLVCMRFAVAAAMTGMFSLPQAVGTFLWLALAGIAVGVAVTWVVTKAKGWIARRFGEDASAQILVSLLLPFTAYLIAEHLHASGILAAVAAGMAMSYAEQTGRTLATTRIRRNAVWDAVQFALNGVMFVVLGEQLPAIVSKAAQVVRDTGHVHPAWMIVYVLAINAALAALRFGWVWVALRLTIYRARRNGTPKQLPGWRLVAATSVAGARGAVTLAGILSLPLLLDDGSPFPARDLAIFLAACVIIVSLVMASTALPVLLRGMDMPAPPSEQRAEDAVRTAAAQAAIQAAQAVQQSVPEGAQTELYTRAVSRLTDYYRERIEGYAAKEIADTARAHAALEAERQVWLAAVRAERAAIYLAVQRRQIPEDTARRMVQATDLLESNLTNA
ncbi:Na+/H+ antiporter [Paenirhodobacter sp.]|uniref:Na+/H+ antiporter n=1 Tax=Paenirhodobacter sp. TaxID=1965326 RepID=UPI003B41485F